MAEEESKAESKIWKYVLGYSEIAAVKCAIELGIPEALMAATDENPMSIHQLSSSINCPKPYLYRIMRFLVHCKVFKEKKPIHGGASGGYVQTALSRRLMKIGEKSMAAFVLLETSSAMLAPWQGLSSRVMSEKTAAAPFEAVHGNDVWGYAEMNPDHSKLINDAMACGARVAVPAVIGGCPEVFEGIGSVVDVGGGNGTTVEMLVKGFPWIHGVNFDLPHVVSVNPNRKGVEQIGGDMFVSVPKADAAFLMWVLHDWGDEECIQILKKCRESIPKDKGKVIIVEAVIEEESEDDRLSKVRLMLDMVMMAHTNTGKERTLKEWDYVIREAGFSHYKVKHVHAVQSVLEVFP